MKLGTMVRLANGEVGTVIYNGLDGVGIKYGEHYPNPEDFEGTTGNLFTEETPDDWPWFPDAILREPWPGCERAGWKSEQCVGKDFEVIQ